MAVKGNPRAGKIKMSRKEYERLSGLVPREETSPVYDRAEVIDRLNSLRNDWRSDIDRGADMSRVIGSAGGIDQTYTDYYQQRMDQLQRYLSMVGKRAMQGEPDDVQGVYSAIRGADNFLEDMDADLSAMPTAAQTALSSQQSADPKLMDRVRNYIAERRGNVDMPDWLENMGKVSSSYMERDAASEAIMRDRFQNRGERQALLQAVEQRKNDDWFAERDAKYSTITARPDFAQNIEGWEEFGSGLAPGADLYSTIANTMERRGAANVMTDEQKQIYTYLLNTEGEDAAEDYYEYISYGIHEQGMQNLEQIADKQTDTFLGKVGASAVSVGANLASGVGALDIVGQNLRNQFGEYRPVDYNSPLQSGGTYAQAVREYVPENMGGAGRFLYGTGMSMADSLAAMAVGGKAGGVLLGMSAAQSAIQNAHERGVTDNQAMASGIFAGAAEMAFESIGIDNLFKMLDTGLTDSARNIIKNIVGQMLAEGGEEVGTTVANTIMDAIIMADKSELRLAIAEYEAQGMSREEATRQAWKDWAAQLGLDFLGGMVSGGIMGGGGQVVNTYGTGRNIQAHGQAQDVLDFTNEYGTDASKALAQRAGSAENASAMQLGRMASVGGADAINPDGSFNMMEAVRRRIAERENTTAQAETQPVATAETAQETPVQTAEEVVEQTAKPTQAVSEAENTAQKTAPRTFKLRAKNKSGETLEITDVTIGQDTNLAFVTADGKEVSADDMDFKGNPKTMQIVKASANLNEDGARGLVANYDGGDVMPYVRSYDLAYREGMANEDMQSVRQRVSNLSDEAFQAAYRAGQIERTMNADTAEIRGGVIRSYTKQSTKNQTRSIEVLDTMFRAIGRTVEIVDSIDITDSKGNVIRKSGSNAQFDEATNRYKIALDAQDEALLNVAVHETIHDIEKNAKAEFDALRDLVFKWLEMNGEDVDILRQRQRALMDGQSDAYYDAEIVANTVPRIFSNRQTFEQFVDKFMKEQPESEKRAFMRMVNRVLEFIKDALRKLSEYSSWAQVKQLRAQHDMLQAVRDQYFEALDVATRQEAEGEGQTKDSLVEIVGESGKNYGIGVYLDSTLLENLTEEERIEMVKEYLKELGGSVFTAYDSNGNEVDVRLVESGRTFRNARGKRSRVNQHLSGYLRNNPIKQEAIALVDELIITATQQGTEPAHHSHGWLDNNGQNVWDAWTTYIQDKEKTIWEATLQIANPTDGEKVLYEIHPIKKVERSGKSAAQSTINSITTANGFDNPRNRNSLKDTVDRAVDAFGVTYSWNETGYLLPNGLRLDFSGKREGAGGGYRTMDHREVLELFDEETAEDGNDAMVQFMAAGNIRISPESGGINLSVKPTNLQKGRLRDFIERYHGEVIVDIDDTSGRTLHSIEYPDGTRASKVVADIDRYFDEGIVPEVSTAQQFRYSAKDVDVEALQAENAQLRAANAELAAQMKRTKGVNLDGRAIRRFAQKLVKREGSTFDADQLANSLSLIYDDMANAENLTDEDAARIIQSGTRLARQVLEQARYFDQDGYDADSAVREFLRDTAVEIPAQYDDAIKRMATNRTDYRAQTRGVLNIVGKGKGVSIDQLWQSGSEDFPTVFSENVTNPEDMVEQLFVIAQGLKEDAYFGDNPYADDLDTAANILFLEMQAELMNIPRVQTLADKASEAAKANRRAERAEARYEKKKTELADVRARNVERREDANRRKYRDRVTRTANSLYQWAAKPNSKNYIPETMRLTVVKMLRALDMEGRMVEEAPKPPTHPGENATKEQMSAYRARETVYKRRLEAYQTKTQAKTTQSILWEQRMLKFADEMQKARGAENGASSFAATTDPELADAIRNYFKENPHVHLATMNAAQMKELSELLIRIEGAVTSENKRHAEYRDQTIAQTAADTKTAWREREEANETVLGKISTSKLAMAQMDAMNTAHMLGGGAQSIIQELRDGEDVFIEHIEEAKQVLEPEIKKLNKSRLSSTKVVQTPAGKYTHAIVLHSTDGDVTLTRAQVMSLYCLNKREQARGHLYGGGIVSTRDGKKRTYRLTEQQVQEACGHLTDTERGVADVMQNLLSTVCAEWGNEATMELYKYKKFREKFYFPISTVELGRDVAYDPNASETTIAQRGFSQNTQENATNAIYIGDVLTVVSKHVADMAEYGAYLTRISDAMRWLNYRGYTDADGTNYVNVKAELVRAFPGKEHRRGKDADKSAMEVYITDLIRSINGGASRTGTSNAITRLAKGAAVGANVSVAIQQPASYARAGVLLSARDLAFAKAGLLSKKERDLMYKYAPITRWKSYGFFQAGTGRNVEALLRGDDNFYQTLREKQGLLAETADNNTWLRLWNACKHEQKRLHKDMDHKSDEFYRLVGKRLSEVIDRTQVVDSPFHRAPIVNDPRYVTLTAFQSEVFKSFGVAQSCTYDVVLEPKSKKAWKALGKGISAHVTAQILAGWLAAAWSAFIRDKDEEKGDEVVERWLIKWGWIKSTGKYTRWEKFLVQGVQRSLGNLNPMRLHWIGNKVSDVIENGFAGAFFGNDSVDSSFFNAISKFIAESIKLVAKRREGEPTDPTKLIGYGLSAGSYGSGLGVATVIRDAQGIYRLIKDILQPEAYAPTMDDVFYYAETGVNEDDMSQVLAAETAKVQEDYPSYSADKAERTARGNLRSEITSEYKEAYAQAFAEGDKETMREIRQFMADTGLYIDGDDPSDACERWLRDYFKNQYLEASTDEERKEARRLLARSGYYDSPRELNEAIEGWTE